jgi:hypothetical protein
MKLAKIFLCLLLSGFGTTLLAQNTIPASGGNANGSGGSVSYTIGQTVYTTNAGTNGSSAQGVQQPYEISVVTGTKEASDITLEIQVYPNPATDFIKLIVLNYEIDNLKYQLYDDSGNLLNYDKVEGDEKSISMGNYSPGIYFLKVIQGNKMLKTFKIIKN